jgi:hypothetical protein
MTAQSQRDRARSLIRALRVKTVANGCTEGEAAAAAAKVRELEWKRDRQDPRNPILGADGLECLSARLACFGDRLSLNNWRAEQEKYLRKVLDVKKVKIKIEVEWHLDAKRSERAFIAAKEREARAAQAFFKT